MGVLRAVADSERPFGRGNHGEDKRRSLMRASVDKDLCASCGVCVDTCPEVFELDEDEKAQPKVDIVPPEAEEACREAAEGCPTEAITIDDA